MSLSKRSIEMLLDLVEIKLSYMDISDREDARDMQVLERCRDELRSLERAPQPLMLADADAPAGRPGRASDAFQPTTGTFIAALDRRPRGDRLEPALDIGEFGRARPCAIRSARPTG